MIGQVYVLGANHDLASRDSLVERHSLDPIDFHDAGDHSFVIRRNKLPASGAVGFKPVVAWRVMAGGDHDAASTSHIAHGERQFGRTTKALEKIDGVARGGHDFSTQAGEFGRVMSCVAGDGAAER